MKYVPSLEEQEILDNHSALEARHVLYRGKGLDFLMARETMLETAGHLDGDILEIGSGKGVTALALARSGYRFTAVDNEKEMLRLTALNLAREGLLDRAELYLMDGYSLEFPDNSFDNVLIVEALHHMHEADRIFSEVDRVLRPGGRVVLSDFNEKGMRIVGGIHEGEGHSHESSSLGEKEAGECLVSRGYEVRGYAGTCHWILVASKR